MLNNSLENNLYEFYDIRNYFNFEKKVDTSYTLEFFDRLLKSIAKTI